jgi:SNF2 family DNA or RNA helicase
MAIKPYVYQEEALQLMQGRESFLLADDMGMGKTVVGLFEIEREYIAGNLRSGRVLVVTIKSALSVWETHAQRILGPWWQDKITILTTKNAADVLLNYKHGLLIVTWDTLKRIQALVKIWFDFVIADEAHYIKNRKTQRTKALKALRAYKKRAHTGTPMINRPDELWSLLHWLFPKQYRSYWRFYERYVLYEEHPIMGYKIFLAPKNTVELNKVLVGIMLRRLKKDYLKDLPDKYYTPILVELSPKQRKAYREMAKEAKAWVDTHYGEYPLRAPSVLAQLTRLRQFAVAYATFGEDGTVELQEPSTKLDAMMEIVQGTDQPVVVFSQFRGLTRLAEDRLEKAGIEFVSMHGGTSHTVRKRYVDGFQDGKFQVFLSTTEAGGQGIDLFRASTVIFLDRMWSPAKNVQAEDRLWRNGQKNAVQVIRIQAKDTVDAVIEDTLAMKWDWIRRIVG